MSNEWYYYLHQNGSLIGKNPIVVDSDPSYFDSPFVEYVWKINTEDRLDGWKLLLEALALGARVDRIREIAAKWGADYKDSLEMLRRSKPTDLMKKGMDIFIKEILKMDVEEYWKEIKHLAEKEK